MHIVRACLQARAILPVVGGETTEWSLYAHNRSVVMAFVTVGVLTAVSTAQAHPVGTFNWQLQPYCNVITLTVVQEGGVVHFDGSDDQCGAARPISAVGDRVPGSLQFDSHRAHFVTTNGGTIGGRRCTDTTVSFATVSGTWRSIGQTGP